MRSAVVGTKRQPNNNRCLVHDSVNHSQLRSSSSFLGWVTDRILLGAAQSHKGESD
jgi:hypothetical protein